MIFTVDECWLDGWLGPVALAAGPHGFRLAGPDDGEPEAHLPGTVLPGFRDAHAHLGLIDPTALLAAGIATVDDLGSPLEEVSALAARTELPEVRFAGCFLTAPGGYPSGRDWASAASVIELATAADAVQAVDGLADAGARLIKLVLHSTESAPLGDLPLTAAVARARERGAISVAHVEGEGQAERALTAGVNRLAHAPWTETLDDELLSAMADTQVWVSTLDIHGYGAPSADQERALDNVRRFRRMGGTVRYGTDLGNGPLPTGLNERELQALVSAGIDGDELVAALTPHRFRRRLSWCAPAASGADDTVAWLMASRVIDTAELKEMLR